MQDINTPKINDVPLVDMSFLNKEWYSYEEYFNACYQVYHTGAWNNKKIGYDKIKIETNAKNEIENIIKQDIDDTQKIQSLLDTITQVENPLYI